MKNFRFLAIFVAAAVAGQCGEKRQADVVVYLHHGNESASVIGMAEGQATRMLKKAGLRVEWKNGKPDYRGTAEVIEAVLTDHRDDGYRAGALASATVGAGNGTRIEVFYNRIRAGWRESAIPPILAHVLVHEITHVLEGVSRHADAGVMKARWDAEDYRSMRQAPLAIAADDLQMLRTWRERRTRTLLAGLR